MPLVDTVWSTLSTWADIAPLINCVLLVFVLGGLIALHLRMRK